MTTSIQDTMTISLVAPTFTLEELREQYETIVTEYATKQPLAFIADPEVIDAESTLTADPLCYKPVNPRDLADMILWSDSFEDEPKYWSLTELVAREGGLDL